MHQKVKYRLYVMHVISDNKQIINILNEMNQIHKYIHTYVHISFQAVQHVPSNTVMVLSRYQGVSGTCLGMLEVTTGKVMTSVL